MAKRLLAAAVIAVALLAPSSPASAATATEITITPSTTTPGSSVTVTATFTANFSFDDVGLQLPAELVGVASWSAISSEPVHNCVINDPDDGGAGCQWTSATIGDSLTITATLSVPANTPVDSYLISTVSQGTPTELSATLTVQNDLVVTEPPNAGGDALADTGATPSNAIGLAVGGIALTSAGTFALLRRRAPSGSRINSRH